VLIVGVSIIGHRLVHSIRFPTKLTFPDFR